MSATFLLTLRSKKTNERVEMMYLSTTPCRQLTGEYDLPYTEDYALFGTEELASFEKAVNEYCEAKERYGTEMVEAKEMALKAVAPQSFMERYDQAKDMYDWASKEYDRWKSYYDEARLVLGVAEVNTDWVLEYYAC